MSVRLLGGFAAALVLTVLAIGWAWRQRRRYRNAAAGHPSRLWLTRRLAPLVADEFTPEPARAAILFLLSCAQSRRKLRALHRARQAPGAALSPAQFGPHTALIAQGIRHVAVLAALEDPALSAALEGDADGPGAAADRLPHLPEGKALARAVESTMLRAA